MLLKEQFSEWYEANKTTFSTMMLEEALLRAWSAGVKIERLRHVKKPVCGARECIPPCRNCRR